MYVCVCVFVCLWLSLGDISMWALWAQLRVVGNHLAQESFILLMHVPQNQTHWCFGKFIITPALCNYVESRDVSWLGTIQVTLCCLVGSWKQKGRLQCTLPTDPVAPPP